MSEKVKKKTRIGGGGVGGGVCTVQIVYGKEQRSTRGSGDYVSVPSSCIQSSGQEIFRYQAQALRS